MLSKTILLFCLLTLMSVMAGCGVTEKFEETNSQEDSTTSVSGKAEEELIPEFSLDDEKLPSEITLYPESSITKGDNGTYSTQTKYMFSGFPSNDRLSFENKVGGGSALTYVTLYYPAKVGYTFQFSDFSDMSFEILEVNPEENFVKLKMTRNGEKK